MLQFDVKNSLSSLFNMEQPFAIHWFRRDLRLEDNTALAAALNSGLPVLPLFIFDTEILDRLEDRADARVSFIHQRLSYLKVRLEERGSTLLVVHGKPLEVWQELAGIKNLETVFTNNDYEPYAVQRDAAVAASLAKSEVLFHSFKDSVIFEKSEVVKDNGEPYSVYTPYSKKWRQRLSDGDLKAHRCDLTKLLKAAPLPMPTLEEMHFVPSALAFPEAKGDVSIIKSYHATRDIPSIRGTSRLGIHLRFGTISTRSLAAIALKENATFLSELIWREFFMQMLWHHPRLMHSCFRPEYEKVQWLNEEEAFQRWCEGRTGYPIVDAGMRELNATGFMHNRVRMITASFLVKHLLIDWRLGEAYFANKLLDFDLASNNGNWQWVAGCGCDAAPYFRIFNPSAQAKRFDPQGTYIRQWVPEWNTPDYPLPMVDHEVARKRCLTTYKAALNKLSVMAGALLF